MNTDGNGFFRLAMKAPLATRRPILLVNGTPPWSGAQQDARIWIGVLLNKNFRWSGL
jgi:hypothetical protein